MTLGSGERKIVEAMRNRMGQSGENWRKASLGSWRHRDGQVCLLGAGYNWAMDYETRDLDTTRERELRPVLAEISQVIVDRYPGRTYTMPLNVRDAYDDVIPEFNDNPETTFEDINLVLKEVESRCG